MRLAESIVDIDISDNMTKFRRLCHANRIDFEYWYMLAISRMYAVNVELECLRNSMGNGIWSKDINYNLISIINDPSVEKYYYIIAHEKIKLIKTAHKEIEMVRRLIETNVHKYENIIGGAGEMDIYALDQACADIDKTIGYTRKIIIMISSIVEKN